MHSVVANGRLCRANRPLATAECNMLCKYEKDKKDVYIFVRLLYNVKKQRGDIKNGIGEVV